MKKVLNYLFTLKEKKLALGFPTILSFYSIGEGSIITSTGKVDYFACSIWYNTKLYSKGLMLTINTTDLFDKYK